MCIVDLISYRMLASFCDGLLPQFSFLGYNEPFKTTGLLIVEVSRKEMPCVWLSSLHFCKHLWTFCLNFAVPSKSRCTLPCWSGVHVLKCWRKINRVILSNPINKRLNPLLGIDYFGQNLTKGSSSLANGFWFTPLLAKRRESETRG